MDEFRPQYPEKPVLIKQKQTKHISITVLSIIVFFIAFSLIIDNYYLIALLLGAVLFHELGHFLVMKLFKYEDLNMLFIPFIGALVSGKKKEYSQIEGAIMILAGPLPGIILGASLLLYDWVHPSDFSIQLGVLLILLNVFNLIPVEPLDGGQLMRVLFFKNHDLTQLILTIISSLAIAISGLFFNSWIIIIFGLLLGFRIKNRHKLYLIRKEMKKQSIRYEANYEDITNEEYSDIQNILLEHTPVLNEIRTYNEEEQYNQLMAKQVDNILASPTKRDASIPFKLFVIILWGGAIWLSAYALLSLDFNLILNAF